MIKEKAKEKRLESRKLIKEGNVFYRAINFGLLGSQYPARTLDGLAYLREQVVSEKSVYSDEQLLKIAPFLKGYDLNQPALESIQDKLTKKLIYIINDLAEKDYSGQLYELLVLLIGLGNLTTGSLPKTKELPKNNPKINFCMDYLDLILSLPTKRERKRMILNLKNL